MEQNTSNNEVAQDANLETQPVVIDPMENNPLDSITNTTNVEDAKKKVTPETPKPETPEAQPAEEGTPEATPETPEEAPSAEPQVVKKSFEEILAEQSPDEVEAYKAFKATVTKEQIEKSKPFEETTAFAEMVDYAGKNKLATAEDFIQHKSVTAEKDEVLAFNKFKAEFKAGEDEEGLEGAELEAVIKEKFEQEYPINSENAKIKKVALADLKEIADEIRKPLETKVRQVKDMMIGEAMTRQHMTAIEEFNKNPKKVSVSIKDEEGKDVVIEAEVTPKIDKKEVSKFLKSDEGKQVFEFLTKAFVTSREDGDKAFGELLNTQFANTVEAEKNAIIAQKGYELGLEKGKSMGIGAKAAFNSKETTVKTTDSSTREEYDGKY